MSDQAEPGRTGRGSKGRHPGEAPAPQVAPEDEPELGEDEARIGAATGVYFTKATGRDVWHAYDPDDETIGRVVKDAEGWRVRAFGHDAPVKFKSATSAKAFIMGMAFAKNPALAELAPAPEAPLRTGTDASHDADASTGFTRG